MLWRTLLTAAAAVVGLPLALTAYLLAVEKGLGRLGRVSAGRLRPWLWLLPALLLLAVFLLYPALNTISLSLRDAGSKSYVGLSNYLRIFSDRDMLIVLRNNLLWLAVFTAATVVLGLLVAVLTDRLKYEAAAKAFIFLPMAISFVAAGVIWKLMYEFKPPGTPQIGAVNAFLTAVFPAFQPKAWLFNRSVNNWALIAVGIWMWTGFAMVILSAGLKGISGELLEAARIDGARELQIFFRIILPLLRPTIVVVGTTLVINVLKIFDIVYVMTNGALGTEVIANRMYKEMFNSRDFGRASALAVLLLLAIIPAMALNLRRFARGRAGG